MAGILQRRSRVPVGGKSGTGQVPLRGPTPFVLATKPTAYVDGHIPYVSGRTGQRLPLDRAKLLASLVLHVTGTMEFVQPAGAAAPAFVDPAVGAYALLNSVQLEIAGSGFPILCDGHGLHVRELAHYPAFAYTPTAPLPPANGGGAPVTTDETWDLFVEVPVAVDQEDLTGLLLLQGRSANVDVVINWASEADVVTLPNGTTATFTGQAEVTGVRYELPPSPQQLPPLNMVHVVEQMQFPLVASGRQRLDLPTGDFYQALYFTVFAGGLVDTADTLGLSQIELTYTGNYRQFSQSAAATRYLEQLRSRSALGAGIYVLDFFADRPRNYLDATALPELKLDLTLDNAPPANSFVRVVTERLQRLVG